MKKKIKLRDMTYEQYKKWYFTKCNGMECKNCPFKFVFCNEDKDYCWVNNKEMFSDKFLNQEVEIEVEMKLTENDRKLLETLRDMFGCERVGRNNTAGNIYFYRDKDYVSNIILDLRKDLYDNTLPILEDCCIYSINDLLKESEENEE